MLRKEKAQLTKNKIFETAIALIKKYGYEKVTVSQICEKAGVAKGTFYVHYQTKEDIIKESYYSDMGIFIREHYRKGIENNNLSIKDKIGIFLTAELLFTEYIGHEMTCRAFITNLSECISGKRSHHFERRDFTKELVSLLEDGVKNNVFRVKQTEEEIFLYIESFIRGLMASWCFANGEFDIVKIGEKYIKQMLTEL